MKPCQFFDYKARNKSTSVRVELSSDALAVAKALPYILPPERMPSTLMLSRDVFGEKAGRRSQAALAEIALHPVLKNCLYTETREGRASGRDANVAHISHTRVRVYAWRPGKAATVNSVIEPRERKQHE